MRCITCFSLKASIAYYSYELGNHRVVVFLVVGRATTFSRIMLNLEIVDHGTRSAERIMATNHEGTNSRILFTSLLNCEATNHRIFMDFCTTDVAKMK